MATYMNVAMVVIIPTLTLILSPAIVTLIPYPHFSVHTAILILILHRICPPNRIPIPTLHYNMTILIP